MLKGEIYKIAASVCDQSVDDRSLQDDSLLRLYDELQQKGTLLCKKFSNVTNALIERRDAIIALSTMEKRKLLKGVLQYLANPMVRLVNLSPIGGSPNAGAIGNAFVFNNIDRVEFIDQSVTGMFEKRTRVEL